MYLGKIMKKILYISITFFWVVMTGLLVFQNTAHHEKNEIKPVKLSLNDIKEHESWMGIYLKDKKIGYSGNSIKKEGKETFKITDETFMKLKFSNQIYDAYVSGSAITKSDLSPVSFSMNVLTSVYTVNISGVIKGNKVEVTVLSGGSSYKKIYPFPKSTYIPILLDQTLIRQDLEIGKTYKLMLFDPETLASDQYMSITLKKKEKIGNEDIYVFEKFYKDMKTTSWVNQDGEIVKEENDFGFKTIREPKEIALAKGKIQAGELISMSSIPSNILITNPRELSFLKLTMRGVKNFTIPQAITQKTLKQGEAVFLEIRKENANQKYEPEKLPDILKKEYLQPSAFIQSNDENIVNKTMEIIADDTTDLEKARKLNKWVFDNLQKIPTFSIPSAVSVLKEKKGDCNEHAVLLTAMLRAAGIPARMSVGLLYLPPQGIFSNNKGGFYYHAWVEAYISENWHAFDATLGQDHPDATHIKLIDGDLDKQSEIIKLIGKIKIKVEGFK